MEIKKEYIKRIFEEYLRSLGLKESTIRGRLYDGEEFLARVKDIREVGIEEVKAYKEGLCKKGYKEKTIRGKIASIKQLFRGLYVGGYLMSDPIQGLKVKSKKGGRVSKVLSVEEVNIFLDSIDINKRLGLRDRAMFELMYGSGLRCFEVCKLNVEDIDFGGRELVVRGGKFSKDRVVPISLVGIRFLKEYVERVGIKRGAVFRGSRGRLSRSGVGKRFKELVKRAGIYREGISVHSLRHSVATHLLEAGCGIRYVQELLGHESIESTVEYTHLKRDNLKRVYKSYHPRENEYYKEVDEEYRERLKKFLQEVKWREMRSKKERERLLRKKRGSGKIEKK